MITERGNAASAGAFTRHFLRGALAALAGLLFWLWTPNAWAESNAPAEPTTDSTAVVNDAGGDSSETEAGEVSGDPAVDEPMSGSEEPAAGTIEEPAPVDGAPAPGEAPPPETVEAPTPIEPEEPAAESPAPVAVTPPADVPQTVAFPTPDPAPAAEQLPGSSAHFYTGGSGLGLMSLSDLVASGATSLQLALEAPRTSDRQTRRAAGDREAAGPRDISPPSLDRSGWGTTGNAGFTAGASGGSASGLVAVLSVLVIVALGMLGRVVSVSVQAPGCTRLILEVERPG